MSRLPYLLQACFSLESQGLVRLYSEGQEKGALTACTAGGRAGPEHWGRGHSAEVFACFLCRLWADLHAAQPVSMATTASFCSLVLGSHSNFVHADCTTQRGSFFIRILLLCFLKPLVL